MNRNTKTYSLMTSSFLKKYATLEQYKNATNELCWSVILKILDDPPSRETWTSLAILFGAWPDREDIKQWVNNLEPKIDHWPWQMRTSLGAKNEFMRLVGNLEIHRCRAGYRLPERSKNPDWQNLKGIKIYKGDVEARHIGGLLDSPYLYNLEALILQVIDFIDGKMPLIFEKAKLPNLIELHLRSLYLKDEDIRDIAKTPIATQIKKLNLSGITNSFHDRTLPLIFESFPNLEVLSIGSNGISAAAIEDILASLETSAFKKIIFRNTTAAKELGYDCMERTNKLFQKNKSYFKKFRQIYDVTQIYF